MTLQVRPCLLCTATIVVNHYFHYGMSTTTTTMNVARTPTSVYVPSNPNRALRRYNPETTVRGPNACVLNEMNLAFAPCLKLPSCMFLLVAKPSTRGNPATGITPSSCMTH